MKPTLKTRYRYVVTYHRESDNKVLRYATRAATASEATAKVIDYIKQKEHHPYDEPYTLIPRVDKITQVNYEI
ncbi:MAG: hypothetical protein KBG19_04355 [Bacteroidales bacterium]|nr:hypothetical protein [Bacteroidales bacterium]